MRIYRISALLCSTIAFCTMTAVFSTTGCGGRKNDSQIIGRLLNDPSEFDNRELGINGKVTQRFDPTGGLLGLGAYQVDDGSGKIWVISRAGVPESGQEIRLKARLRHDPLPGGITIPNGISVTLLDEVERRLK